MDKKTINEEKDVNSHENLAENASNLKNDEQTKEEIASDLVLNIETKNNEKEIKKEVISSTEKAEVVDDSNKIFKKFKIKDIVFLAIMAAVTFVTSGFMPLLAKVNYFGIIQVGLGLQFSIFPTIGMLKVKKTGSLLFMALCTGVIMAFMNTVMFFCVVICALIVEALVILIFRGYKSNWASFFAGALFFPLTLPFLYVYYNFMFTAIDSAGAAVQAFVGSSVGEAVGMSAAVVVICVIGATLGMLIMRELRKSGAIKK